MSRSDQFFFTRCRTSSCLNFLFPALVLVVLFGLVGCKKITFDLAKSDEPKDTPEYTVEFNPNLSPAEGGVRKPN